MNLLLVITFIIKLLAQSNIFNLLVVIGITSSIIPINGIDDGLIYNDMLWVVLFSVIILPLAYIKRKNDINVAFLFIFLIKFLERKRRTFA